MIYILHGDNLSRSRSLVVNQQKKIMSANKTELDIKDATPAQLKTALISVDFFGNAPFVVFSASTNLKILKDYVEVIFQTPEETVLIVVAPRSLPMTNPLIKKAADVGAKVLESNAPPASNIFSFIDALFALNRKRTYLELAKLQKDLEDPIKIFTMMVYGLRNLALVKFNSPGAQKLDPFVKRKSERMSKNFNGGDLKKVYSDFYQLDVDLKTGGISTDMVLTVATEKILAYA